MEIISLSYPLSDDDRLAYGVPQTMAIGHFDGVHKGHQKVISRAVQAARAEGIRASVMTFSPHPKEVLGQGDRYMMSLTPLEDKMARFADLGVDTAYVFRFDQTFAKVTPEQFVKEVLQALQVKRAVVGFDFTFGHRGAGDPAMLESLGAPLMQVDVAEPFHLDNKKVSSTSIRERLLEGNVEEAARLLGRPYQISGVVSHGDGRGRTIGYPTANISLSGRYVLPRLGVYAVILRVGDRSCPGVMNIGVKPTFGSNEAQPTPEVHLFDFNGDLYGQLVHVDIQSFIRAEQRFNSVEQLIDQINKDALRARQLLQNMNNISSF